MASMSKTASEHDQEIVDTPGEATILVSEFPPPPNYFRSHPSLEPPEIPLEALQRGTQRAAAEAERIRVEAERMRLRKDATDIILGGTIKDDTDDGQVVAVFGEIVEDPFLVRPLDACEDPKDVRDQVKRLNLRVVKGFISLLQDLVHRPGENKNTRDELSHNIFLMLQECNKFREHQAREMLIELLDRQLTMRRKLLAEIQLETAEADRLI